MMGSARSFRVIGEIMDKQKRQQLL